MKTTGYICLLLGALLATACGGSSTSVPSSVPTEAVDIDSPAYAEQREQLVEQSIVTRGVSDQAVIEAMQTVPRHAFVPSDYLSEAYRNYPLPIGYGQTISQPYIVALMTEALALDSDAIVLEIGTGSGYQAAVLAEIVDQVYTIEIIGELADRAANTLAELGYDNIEVRHGDGYFGWEEQAPFDAIIVTAAPDHIPPPLVAQLAEGARMVIPVGPVGGYQELWLVGRQGDQVITESLGGVAFVPFTREVTDD